MLAFSAGIDYIPTSYAQWPTIGWGRPSRDQDEDMLNLTSVFSMKINDYLTGQHPTTSPTPVLILRS
jgi:hypothetical protein